MFFNVNLLGMAQHRVQQLQPTRCGRIYLYSQLLGSLRFLDLLSPNSRPLGQHSERPHLKIIKRR